MSKSFRRDVRWNRQAASYQVIEQAGSTITAANLDFQSHVWQQWLEQVSSFAFQSKHGHHFTARKEARARGDAYWIAYRKVSGKLTHKYLGRTTDVTLTRLEQVAATLAGQEIQATISETTDGHREGSMQEPLADELLATKFFIPSSPHVLVFRPRLFTLLDEGLQRSLTVVSAPAGFGKTTLLSAWVQTLPNEATQVVWVSLDEQDNDLVRFWMYIFTALDRLQPGMCSEFMAYLQTQQAPPIQYLLTALINRFSERTDQWLLVLDDYHLVTEQAIHTSLTYLVDHLPPQLRLLLSTRMDPPLPLSRLRVRGQMLEVRPEQLRCTLEEAGTFFKEVIDLELAGSELEQVTSRTEGWLVGLQLVGLSLQGRATPTTNLLEELNGNHDYILDYLTEEVLERQPATIQTFLLRTSILSQLTAPLCDAVLGKPGSQQILELLERSNLFLTPLDSSRHWYRYHALFAEALRYRLEQTFGEEVSSLHLLASRWYAERGYTHEAVAHAFNAREWQRVADLIEQIYALIWMNSEHAIVRRWLEKLPAEVVRSRPRLCLAYAKTLFMVAPYTTMEHWLHDAETALQATFPIPANEAAETGAPPPLDRHAWDNLYGEIAAYRAIITGYYLGEGHTTLAFCQDALVHLAEQNLGVRAEVAYAQSLAYHSFGDIVPAIQSAREATELAQAAGNTSSVIVYLCRAAYSLLLHGKLHEVVQLAQQATHLGTTPTGLPHAMVCWASIFHADVLRQWNRLDEALDLVLGAIRLSEQTETIVALYLGYTVLTRVYLARGEMDAARRAFQHAEEALMKTYSPYRRDAYLIVDWVQFWLASGELQRAIRWAQELAQQTRVNSPFAREREEVARARMLLAQKRPTEVLSLLEPLLVNAEKQERLSHVIEMQVLQALAHHLRDEEQDALDTLAQAVHLAEPEGYIRSFVDEGTLMYTLLTVLRERERKRGPTPYLDSLLDAFAQQEGAAQATQPLTSDHISPREREVLHLLAQGCSNQEIADALVVTVETVKRHVSSLLAKLGVDNRTQAAMRAHALGLYSEQP